MATKPRKRKAITLEDLADSIQKDFARMATKDDVTVLKNDIVALGRDMATKDDLKNLATTLRDEMETLHGDLATKISNVKDDLQEQIAGLKYAKEIDELRGRVARLEGKLGIKHAQRAA